MDLIQEGGYFLDFIKHDPAIRRPAADHGFEEVGIAGKLEKERGVKKVKPEGVGEDFSQPCALACPTGAE